MVSETWGTECSLLLLAVPIRTVSHTENLSNNFFSKRKSSKDGIFPVLANNVNQFELIVLLPNEFSRSKWPKICKKCITIPFLDIVHFSRDSFAYCFPISICFRFTLSCHMLKQLKQTRSTQRAFLCQQSRNWFIYEKCSCRSILIEKIPSVFPVIHILRVSGTLQN